MREKSVLMLILVSLPSLILALTGCSRGDIPLPTIQPSETPSVSVEIYPTQSVTPIVDDKYPLQVEFASVWASIEDGLVVRNQAGISATIADVIPWNSRHIELTGNRSLLGSSLWLEIQTEDGVTGWVSSWNLTEFVPSSQFCADDQIKSLLDAFIQVFQDPDDSSLRGLISPNRGLSIRLNWYSQDVTFTEDDVDTIFSDTSELDWGIMADSGLMVTGTFGSVIQPKLDDVFTDSPEILCNELKWGNTAGEVIWPEELDRLNFYAYYRPAKEGGNLLDWRTWAIGIEYVDHQPYIAVLIHYSSEL
jgi:hypothetical protein